MSHPVHLPHPPVTAGDRAAMRYLIERIQQDEARRDDSDPHPGGPTLGWLEKRFPTL